MISCARVIIAAGLKPGNLARLRFLKTPFGIRTVFELQSFGAGWVRRFPSGYFSAECGGQDDQQETGRDSAELGQELLFQGDEG